VQYVCNGYCITTHSLIKKSEYLVEMGGKGVTLWIVIIYEEIYLNDYRSVSELRYPIKNLLKNTTLKEYTLLLRIEHPTKFISAILLI